MDLKLDELAVTAEKIDQIDLWERLEHVKVTAEFNLHHKVLHVGRALQQRADGGPAPLDAAQREVFQIWELPGVHPIHPPCINFITQFTTQLIASGQHEIA